MGYTELEATNVSSGAGSRLPTAVLAISGLCTLVAVLVSAMSIHLQLKNYRKPILQRMVVRIMIMVPIYAISSLIALFSLEAAFVIDVIRDIYEAFVIYCFFGLLLSYLGGERSLLILLHGRPPKVPVFPVNIFKREIDVSDPYTFLFLKRGILQYVQVKPVLAVVTLILKVFRKYNEGDFRANSGYLYVSIIYNTSIFLSLYCLAMFWVCVNNDLTPFRPVPKFLCVKGILFFSFWQSIAISILVAAGAITKLGPYTDSEHISLGLTDTLICIEMPLFAFAHMYAFSHTDYIDPHRSYVARMPMYYAFRDAFGYKDVVEDSKATLRGEGMDYREFEPSEGYMHQGIGRDRRIRAGLRYSKGGKGKYWLPKTSQGTQPPGLAGRGVNRAITKIAGRDQGEEVYAPLLADEEEDVVHLAHDLLDEEETTLWKEPDADGGYELPFGELDDGDEELFHHSKKYVFGDYNYPCIDISSESARGTMWDEEERILRDERGAWFSPLRGAKGQKALDQRDGPAWAGYGAVGSHPRNGNEGQLKGKGRENKEESAAWTGESIIDLSQDRTPAANQGDVRLKWTKTKPLSRSNSSSADTRIRPLKDADRLSSNISRSSSPGESSTRSPSLSRASSRWHRGSPKQVLPPDAVDLVVEDNQAAENEKIRERRKGEPASRGPGPKRVYRREFVAGNATEGVEEELVEDPVAGPGTRSAEAGQATNIVEDVDTRDFEREKDVLEQGVLARVQTPPVHARIVLDGYHVPGSDDENPWV